MRYKLSDYAIATSKQNNLEIPIWATSGTDTPILITNLLSAEICDKLCSLADSNPTVFEDIKSPYGTDYLDGEDLRKALMADVNLIADLSQYALDYKVAKAIQDVYKVKGIKRTRRWLLIKNIEKDYFLAHSDNCVLAIGNTVLLQFKDRQYTSVLYLNSQDESFEGGSLVFEYIIDEQGNPFEYKPKKGELVVFGADFPYRHTVKEITSGVRYTLSNFWGK